MQKKIMVVAAHPDDEILGCGGTIARHVIEGDEVQVVFTSDGVGSRETKEFKNNLISRKKEAVRALKILNTRSPIFLDFPDNSMDSVPLLDVIKPLEKLISEFKPKIIYTHHHGDLNIDHSITCKAVITASRPSPSNTVNEIYCFEVLSSTEILQYSHNKTFLPAMFVDISEHLDIKMLALSEYSSELREFPQSRSIDSVRNLALVRGSSVGLMAAEAFSVLRIIK